MLSLALASAGHAISFLIRLFRKSFLFCLWWQKEVQRDDESARALFLGEAGWMGLVPIAPEKHQQFLHGRCSSISQMNPAQRQRHTGVMLSSEGSILPFCHFFQVNSAMWRLLLSLTNSPKIHREKHLKLKNCMPVNLLWEQFTDMYVHTYCPLFSHSAASKDLKNEERSTETGCWLLNINICIICWWGRSLWISVPCG